MPDEAFKSLGALSITLVFAVTAFIVWRWPRGTKASGISGHAGAQRVSYLLFASALTIGGSAFLLFMLRWLGPTIGVGWPFYTFVIVGFYAVILLATYS